MVVHMAAWIVAYLILSFFLAALYVRKARRSKWTKFLRKYFYFFPALPIALPFLLFSWLILSISRRIFSSTRRIFEKLSGKKTYRRKSIYYRQ